MKKRILLLILILAIFSIALAGCGEKEESDLAFSDLKVFAPVIADAVEQISKGEAALQVEGEGTPEQFIAALKKYQEFLTDAISKVEKVELESDEVTELRDEFVSIFTDQNNFTSGLIEAIEEEDKDYITEQTTEFQNNLKRFPTWLEKVKALTNKYKKQ